MPATQVQKAGTASTGNSTTISATFGAAPTAGNTVIVVGNADTTIQTPSGFTLATSAVDFTGLYLWYRVAQAGDSATVTLTLNASKSAEIVILEYSGLTSAPLDKFAHNTPGGTGQTSVSTGTTATTTQADELAIAAAARFSIPNQAQTITWSNSFVTESAQQSSGSATNDGLWVASKTLAATGTQTTTGTFGGSTTSHPGGLVATFLATAVADTDVSDGDTGSGTPAATIAAELAAGDLGTAAEGAAVSVLYAASDGATGTDAASAAETTDTRGSMTPGTRTTAAMSQGTSPAATMTPGTHAGAMMTGGAT